MAARRGRGHIAEDVDGGVGGAWAEAGLVCRSLRKKECVACSSCSPGQPLDPGGGEGYSGRRRAGGASAGVGGRQAGSLASEDVRRP
ncbi:hypothetical protein E2C01_036649 [Portunus trituberculatus]|uniref:Uncharacterized protein n=1 Tax=Portunus trituberculatus TaxID=210409 RepID=A0A5B7FEV9_PORTR|nr:hypothetical protein [Portunus trituberculatus]